MLKRPILVLLCAWAAGCGREQQAAADPVEVDRLLARLEAGEATAVSASAYNSEKISRAERLVAPLEKVQPDKIDPDLAFAMIGG